MNSELQIGSRKFITTGPKPRIKKGLVNGWICECGLGPIGWGITPVKAYWDWMAEVRRIKTIREIELRIQSYQ